MWRFCVAAVVACVAALPAHALDLRQPAPAVSPLLGISFPGNTPDLYDYLVDAGIGRARISASWRRIQPKAGQWDFVDLDRRVQGLQARGIAPFVTFESDADWATRPETQKVKNAVPLNKAEWAQFVSAVVERYDGDGIDDMQGLAAPIRHYQAANEFTSDTNASGGWTGTNAELLAYVNTARAAVRQADPNAVFVLGGLAAFVADAVLVNQGHADWTLRQQMEDGRELVMTPDQLRTAKITALVEGRVRYLLQNADYDMADIHLYGPQERDDLRLALLREWSGRPVMSSECGGPNLDYGDTYTPEGHFMQAITRNLDLLSQGAAVCMWFGLGEEMRTTVGNARVPLYDMQRQPKPAVFAYRLLARILPYAQRIVRIEGGWQITDAQGQALQIYREGRAPVGVATHCVAKTDLSRVVEATNGVSCVNEMLVFAGPLGKTALTQK